MAFSGLGIWVISLERAKDRRARMLDQMKSCPQNFHVFDGIDASEREDELLSLVDIPTFERNMGRKILIGGIGCYNSHLGVWREFLSSGHEVALILEDDNVLHDDFWEAVEAAMSIRSHWDILKLNRVRAKLPVVQGTVGPYSLNAYLGPATGTGAYLINRETAQRQLPRMLPIRRATDHEINRYFEHKYRLFGLEPFPSHIEDNGVSYIMGPNKSRLRKLVWYERLPNYRNRAVNYFLRLGYLIRIGAVPGSRKLLHATVNEVAENTTPARFPEGSGH